MLRCIVIDDKPLAIDILKEYITKIPFLDLVHSTQNPIEALEYINNNGVDLIYLDIQMPEINGIQFMKLLDGKSKVILTTAYSEYALEGYEHDVLDYLLKPVSFNRFYKASEKARKAIEISKVRTSINLINNEGSLTLQDSLFVKTEHKVQRISLQSVLYIEAKQNYIAIFTELEKIMSLQNIKTIEPKLPADRFLRVHKSFIVSLDKIINVERSRIKIGNTLIPIGDNYRDSFFNKIGT